MQAGGHRFDPGTLHSKVAGKRGTSVDGSDDAAKPLLMRVKAADLVRLTRAQVANICREEPTAG